MKRLGRPLDLDGYNTYSKALSSGELTLRDIDIIISESDESILLHDRKLCLQQSQARISNVVNTFTHPPHVPHFHVVISRFNEPLFWIYSLALFNCTIFIYNKGHTIPIALPDNVHVIRMNNIAYEDYVYIYHIINQYHYYREHHMKVLFSQCGIDHCSHILHALTSIQSFGSYTSLFESIGHSNSWSDNFNTWNTPFIAVDRAMSDIGGGIPYLSEFKLSTGCNVSDLYAFYCDKWNVTQMNEPIFSPCAIFVVDSVSICQIPLRTFILMKSHVTHVHQTTNPFMAKVLASIIERLWYTLFRPPPI